MATKPLRVLLVEDSPDDAALVLRELKRGGFAVESQRVDTAPNFLAALGVQPWDLILSDFSMPHFNGMLAFETLLELGLDIPFIFVSGRIGEDRAAEAMLRGAKDYVLKDNLTRLVPAVERELKDSEERRKRRAGASALRESEQKYRHLLEASIQGVGVIRDLKLVFANSALAELFGFESIDELLAEDSILKYFPQGERLKLNRVYRDRLAGRDIPARAEMRIFRRDGAEMIVDASLKVVPWDGQEAVLAVLVDITERKRAEEALSKSEEKYRSLVETSIQGVCVVSRMKIVFLNSAMARMFGYETPEQVLKTGDLFQHAVEEDKSRLVEFSRARLSGGPAPTQFEFQAIRTDGQRIWCETSSAAILWEGKPAVLATLVDITERRRAEEELRASQRLMRTVFDTIPHALQVKDLDSRYLMVNRAWCERYGLAPDDVVGKLTMDTPSRAEEDRRRALEQDLKVFADNMPVVFEGVGTIRDGQRRHFQSIKAPLRNDSGEVAGLVGIVVDLTELKRAEEKVRASERLLQTVVDTLPLTLAVKDRESRYLLVNRNWCERYGMRPEEVLGQKTLDAPGRTDVATHHTVTEDQIVMAGDSTPIVFEGWRSAKDQELRAYHCIKAPFHDGSGQVAGLVSATIDITDVRRAEEKVGASERLLQTVFDTLPVHLVVKDAETRYLMVNRAWCERYGLTPEQVIGKTSMEMPGRPEADKLHTLDQDRKTLVADSKTLVFEGWDTTATGELRHFQSLRAPLRDESGKVIGLVGATVDLTELKRAEEKVRASERLLQTVFDTLPVDLVVKDAEARYLMVNQAWCDRFGLTPEQAIGKTVMEVPGRPEVDRLYTLEQDRKILVSNSKCIVADGKQSIATGETRHFQSIRAPLRNESGTVTGLVGATFDLTELKRAEEKLQASERLLQTVFDTIPHALFVKDPSGRYLMVNPAWCERYEMQPEDAIGRLTLDVPGRPEADKRRAAEEDQRVMSGDQGPISFQSTDTTRDGRVLYFQSFKAPLKDDSGAVTGLVGVVVDTTEIKRAEQEVRASQRLLRTVFDTIPHMLVVKDTESRLLMVNKAYSDAFGISAEEAANRSTLDLPYFPEAEKRGFLEEDRQVFAGENANVVGERIFTIKGGAKLNVHSIKAPLLDESGKISGMVGLFVDITAEREAQRKADVAHARLYDAIESLPAGFFLYDAEERLVLWNSRVRELFPRMYAILRPGMFFEEVLRGVTDAIAAAAGRPEEWVQERLAQFRTSPGSYEQPLADGRWVQGLDRRTSDGGTVCLRFDITDLKAGEHQLRQAQKMEAVGQLTGGVAHDFNNVLQVIAGYIELAQAEVPPSHPAAASLFTAADACRRAADLTQQLLAFSRKQVLRPQELDLGEVARGISKLMGRLLPANVVLDVRDGEAVEPIVADRGMIEQVLMNLAVNARDAMPDGGRIEVEAGTAVLDDAFCHTHVWAKRGRYTTLRFSDTGSGMTPEVMEHAFEPFFTTKGTGKGTGLGLSTVYGIVQQHEGLIRIESEPGAGTTFWIYLPVRGQNRLEVEAAPAGPVPGGMETILVAEDEEKVRTLLVAALQSVGYRVLTAAHGEEALSLLARQGTSVALAILDMTMPQLGGRETYLRMKEIRPDLRAMFSSGWFSPEEQRFLAAEHQTFVYKPYSRDQFLRAVRHALDRTNGAG